ncbi:hypothetical protein V8G54_023522 [Vigna mungo]|uniref:Methyltransferase type 11 domain-containing protein n=1 Tax=Vigna mungo TaxID=3915 RepID=A0AAQ3RSL7_VIGMU
MAQRILSAVHDWSSVKLALDLSCCGRDILLNAVATQMKKEGSYGCIVGLDRSKRTTILTLRATKMEGVDEYVTCREGDTWRLPFLDNYFDMVVSSVFVHMVRREYDARTAEAATKRMRAVAELELKMEDVRVSERVTAFMGSSHIVSFWKPSQHVHAPPRK